MSVPVGYLLYFKHYFFKFRGGQLVEAVKTAQKRTCRKQGVSDICYGGGSAGSISGLRKLVGAPNLSPALCFWDGSEKRGIGSFWAL